MAPHKNNSKKEDKSPPKYECRSCKDKIDTHDQFQKHLEAHQKQNKTGKGTANIRPASVSRKAKNPPQTRPTAAGIGIGKQNAAERKEEEEKKLKEKLAKQLEERKQLKMNARLKNGDEGTTGGNVKGV